MAVLSKPPITPEVAELIGECAERVENRSLLLDKFVLHKAWPPVRLESTGEPMKMDDASRWSFIRIAQNGGDFLQREFNNCERLANGRNASDANREKASIKQDVLQSMKSCACRQLPRELANQKIEQNRWFAQSLSKRSRLNAVIYGELQGRLIVNLSDSLIQNAGICLDRNTGLPFIPGSAVKGVSRHVALEHLINGAWTLDEFVCVFGCSEADFKDKGELRSYSDKVDVKTRKGGVDFLSARPITEPTIVVDISNVHYPDYYKTGELRNLSNEKPNPNTFPAIEKGVRYAFCVVANGMDGIDDGLFAKVRDVLVEAITVRGLGAKTGAGYGWFTDVTEEVEKVALREKEIAEAKRLASEVKAKEEAARMEAKAEAQRIASLSPCDRILERWSLAPNLKAIVNGNDISKFDNRADDEKKGIVEALRTDGIGAKVWAIIKGVSTGDPKKKLRNPSAESTIRGYCKNTLKLGKMP